jgi:hypothetical protein
MAVGGGGLLLGACEANGDGQRSMEALLDAKACQPLGGSALLLLPAGGGSTGAADC